MAMGGIRSWPRAIYRLAPPIAWCADRAYRWIAGHRRFADVVCRLTASPVQEPATHLLTRRIFLRLLGLIYLAAFLSLGPQLAGLVGSGGLQPISTLLHESGTAQWWQLPTLQWLGGDGALQWTWIVGTIAAGCLVLGLVPLVATATCWAMYLSLTNAGGVFLQYQWDALLLECGVLAILWAPWTRTLNSPDARRPSALVHWLLILLLARLVFFAAVAKVQHADPTWADCSALSYHFWTQPLPWIPAWWAASLPPWTLRLACQMMFIVEFAAPVLLLGPRVPRTIGAALIAALMVGIALTGNYGFFNWLTIVLCLAALDDAVLLRLWPRVSRGAIRVGMVPAAARGRRWVRRSVAAALLLMVGNAIWAQSTTRPGPLRQAASAIAPWRLVNHYGLFATMTTSRPEIRIEWCDQAGTWHEVVFLYKPGPRQRAGAFCQPGMPRLDWQLWFDALSYQRALRAGLLRSDAPPLQLTGREVLPALLQGIWRTDPQVLALLEVGPSESPTAIRWHLDAYQFADSAHADGDWWTSQRLFSSKPLRFRPAP